MLNDAESDDVGPFGTSRHRTSRTTMVTVKVEGKAKNVGLMIELVVAYLRGGWKNVETLFNSNFVTNLRHQISFRFSNF